MLHLQGTLDPTGLVMLVVLETTRLSALRPKRNTSAIPPQHHIESRTGDDPATPAWKAGMLPTYTTETWWILVTPNVQSGQSVPAVMLSRLFKRPQANHEDGNRIYRLELATGFDPAAC